MHDENDRDFLKAVDGKGLESIDDNNEVPNVITSLRHIHPNQYYRINASILQRSKKELSGQKLKIRQWRKKYYLLYKMLLMKRSRHLQKPFLNEQCMIRKAIH
ncbi:hypothetical protein Glove_251g23 [Diversispora epigaea]|uniref:Uncharacterized protein n=1 Tax=Diversispora epigaea TaxID=1348612 RepID=A0A397IDN2_9GLOM|nr:hypothetical protein Glove_251g23 [Diversispora epigaea]